MLKERARLLNVSVFSIDLALVAVAFIAAHWVRSVVLPSLAHGSFPSELYALRFYLPLLPVALSVWGLLLLRFRRYRSHRTTPLLREAWEVVQVSGAATVTFTLLLYVLRLDERMLPQDRVSRAWLLLFAAIACLLLLAEKVLLRVVARYVRSRGLNYRTLLLVGTGPSALALARKIAEHAWWGFRLIGCVEVSPSSESNTSADVASSGGAARRAIGGLPILGHVEDVPRILQDLVVDDVVFAVGRRELEGLDKLYEALHEQGIRTFFSLDFFPHEQAKAEITEIDGIPLLTYANAPTNPLLLASKRALDVALSSLILLLALPIIVLVAIAVRLTSGGAGGNVLFRQTRCGLNGRRFTLYKFRTMTADAEERLAELQHLNEMDGPVFKVRDDPRVTRVGRVLRKFSLDELPQLWNVLRGDMSLVGPRPPIPEEVARYERWQRRRLSMKPGLTCLWQVNGRNELDFGSWIELDLQYIDSWSLSLDLKILLKTIPVVLSGRGAS
ncbi:MAG TPA: sugar transferase [Thermoanaerobaculia bacterium]|jgi:exopolysaccharide biosynthesis polyprenyl glycosylphosphotransferase|nr:sugar transferase [Thermoanaerobaculia bacterium]